MSHADLSWAEARRVAAGATRPLPAARVPLDDCLGLTLAESLPALVDLPPFATSAMDGWAVAGPGPWKVTGRVLAGQDPPRLGDGEAVEIATGARLPPGASAVLRRERGALVDGRMEGADLPIGADIRPQGQESATVVVRKVSVAADRSHRCAARSGCLVGGMPMLHQVAES